MNTKLNVQSNPRAAGKFKDKYDYREREETPPDPSPKVPVRDLEVQSFPPRDPDPVSLTEPS